MASLSEVDGGRRIYYKSANGSRQILYVSKMTKKQAEAALRCMIDLERCRIDGTIPAPATTLWLAGVSKELHAKLAKHGLCQPRVEAVAPMLDIITIDELIRRYKARPKWLNKLKESTRRSQEISFGYLRKHLGAETSIEDITTSSAEDMVDGLTATLAEATVAKITVASSMLMRFAVKSRWLNANPFDGIPRGSDESPHKDYVDAATAMALIDACPDSDTKLVVALARFAGLRVPSEPRVLKRADVDWSGHRFRLDSPKTGPRVVPVLPVVMRLLEQQFERAEVGAEFVLPQMGKQGGTGYCKRVRRIAETAGIKLWSRTLHTLRASMQTDWNELFPAHVTASWLGNSPAIGDKHYNRTLEAHFKAATQPTQNPTQPAPDTPSHDATEIRVAG